MRRTYRRRYLKALGVAAFTGPLAAACSGGSPAGGSAAAQPAHFPDA
jgi:hypothetical protein